MDPIEGPWLVGYNDWSDDGLLCPQDSISPQQSGLPFMTSRSLPARWPIMD